MASQSIRSTARSLWQNLAKDTLTLQTRPIPVVKPNSDEHLVRVHATALCARELLWPKLFPVPGKEEIIPGYDLAGTVVVAPSSSPFKEGDEVYARTNYIRPGCARDYTVTTAEELAIRPRGLTWPDTAVIPLSALTAWQALFDQAGFATPDNAEANRGKRLLVTAASGGVGLWVLQLANVAGLHIIASCGAENDQFVKDLGADEVVNYRTTKLTDWALSNAAGKVDVVIDCYGGETLADAWGTVKNGGSLISIVEPPEGKKPADSTAQDVRNFFFIMQPSGKQLAKITDLVNEGKCHGVLDSVYPLEEFEKAFERVGSRKAKGKVVLKLTDD
ncbi:hypothetical protein AJ80_09165 [Polytolypa hystricis UAMH7299]|uniref:Enoyl reductase (ER) domain-containing protein n=1 Tax=Polytolypa hystricis (strain UAMH7299) TaxID=1447883 RepID=A0A2B7WVE1_POLH7|nr:hypothetical protein AJ80_09165 [Polytolypa hystricis UAMH7299]